MARIKINRLRGFALIKVELKWFNVGPVKSLYEILKPENYYNNPLLSKELNTYGIQAFDKSNMALRRRVRWEIVKDGNGCAESAFCKKCKEHSIDRFNLLLKVAHPENPKKDGSNVTVDPKFMNAVEMALIFEIAQAGDPLMNKTGKKRYRLEPIEILNCGDYTPLPARIVL